MAASAWRRLLLPESRYINSVLLWGLIMNLQLGRQVLTKSELERMVLTWLRMLPCCQHLKSVEIAHRPRSDRNWALIGTEPPLSTLAENEARNALMELQRDFRLQVN